MVSITWGSVAAVAPKQQQVVDHRSSIRSASGLTHTHRRRARRRRGCLCACARTRLSAAFAGFPPSLLQLDSKCLMVRLERMSVAALGVFLSARAVVFTGAATVSASLNSPLEKAMIHSQRDRQWCQAGRQSSGCGRTRRKGPRFWSQTCRVRLQAGAAKISCHVVKKNHHEMSPNLPTSHCIDKHPNLIFFSWLQPCYEIRSGWSLCSSRKPDPVCSIPRQLAHWSQ